MSKKRKILRKLSNSRLPVFLFLFGAVGVLVLFGMEAKRELAINAPEPSIPMRTQGRPDAPIKIIEYGDLQCEPCATGSQKLKEYMKAHPGDIFVEFKHFPLDQHKNSLRAAIYSDCAGGQGKFWSYVDKLFGQQDKWKNLINPDHFFEQMAYDLEINKSELSKCIENPKIKEAILKQREHGEFLGLDNVPTYYINKKMLAGDDALIEKIKEAINNK